MNKKEMRSRRTLNLIELSIKKKKINPIASTVLKDRADKSKFLMSGTG